MSDGKSSVHCVVFFQSAEANSEAAAPAPKPAKIKAMPVPLPGENTIPESHKPGHSCPKNDKF